ncbi:MAG: 30S ribosomal protein S7 [Cytophagaceae bacterium]|nr:MAG: 30S ribosomal protein S7 [Cytophagaceae bacterium]
MSSIAAGVPFPIIGILFGQLLDDFNAATCDQATDAGDGDQGSINSTILIIFYLAIAQFVCIYVHLTCWTLNGARLAQRLRESYLQNLLRQEPSFFDNLPPGEVASRLHGDIQTIRSGTAEKVGICLSSASFFVTAYIVAFIKDWKLAAELLSLIPAYFIMSIVGSHYIEKYSGMVSDYAASAASIASEALNNIMPSVEVKSRRVGGSNFQVPIEVRPDRKISLGIKWMISYARKRGEKTMMERLAGEIIAGAKGEGAAVKKKDDTHRMAEANKAFSHFRF